MNKILVALILLITTSITHGQGCLYHYDTWVSHSKHEDFMEGKATYLYNLSENDCMLVEKNRDSLFGMIMDKYEATVIDWLYDFKTRQYFKPNDLFYLETNTDRYDFEYPTCTYLIDIERLKELKIASEIVDAIKIFRSYPKITIIYRQGTKIIDTDTYELSKDLNTKKQLIKEPLMLKTEIVGESNTVEIIVTNSYGDKLHSIFKF